MSFSRLVNAELFRLFQYVLGRLLLIVRWVAILPKDSFHQCPKTSTNIFLVGPVPTIISYCLFYRVG